MGSVRRFTYSLWDTNGKTKLSSCVYIQCLDNKANTHIAHADFPNPVGSHANTYFQSYTHSVYLLPVVLYPSAAHAHTG